MKKTSTEVIFMRYIPDHDLHIHSQLSPCSSDPNQTPAAILAYGIASGFRLLNLTDHCWDRDVECPCNTWGPMTDAMSCLPLPQNKRCHFIYGIEADMNQFNVLGISKEHAEMLDFCVIATNHMHLYGFASNPEIHGYGAEERARRYKERLHAVMEMDLPFHKCGLAHFTTGLVCEKDPMSWHAYFSDAELKDIFTKAAKLGMGIELNFNPDSYKGRDLITILRPYLIAKEVGCKFYFAGDAHHPGDFYGMRERNERIISLLTLEESDKMPFIPETIAKLDAGGDSLGKVGLLK